MWTFQEVNCTLSGMKRQFYGRPIPRRSASCTLLLFLVSFVCLVWSANSALSQQSRISTTASPGERPAIPAPPPPTQVAPLEPAPNGAPFQLFHLVAALCSGLVISAARLARKFRRFWGLGVFTNPWALLFLLLSVGICGAPVTTEGVLKGVPLLGNLGPWIADMSGILLALALPALSPKSKKGAETEKPARDLVGGSSSNSIWVIENAIEEWILQRMQKEVVLARSRYDWTTIKLAAGRALEEEMTIRPMSDETYEAARLKIESFEPDSDPRQDLENKYKALLILSRWFYFKRLLNGLDQAKRETEA
jgi:hypothetical protein